MNHIRLVHSQLSKEEMETAIEFPEADPPQKPEELPKEQVLQDDFVDSDDIFWIWVDTYNVAWKWIDVHDTI